MKKVRIIILFMTLFLGMFFIMPARVSAYTYNPDKAGEDFTPYINQIVQCGLAQEDIKDSSDGYFSVFISDKGFKYYQFFKETDFSSEIAERMTTLRPGPYLRDYFDVSALYWNPWLQFWQIEYPVEPNITAVDWFNHISLFDFGLAYGEINDSGVILIVEEPGHEYEVYRVDYGGDWEYFEPELGSRLENWYNDDDDIIEELESYYGQDFDGYLYWNFEEGYWQIEYYEITELDYYMQRVDDLEDEISSLENEISSLEDEISSLEDEISSLENNDITKWFVPLVVIIIIVGIIEPIILFKRKG